MIIIAYFLVIGLIASWIARRVGAAILKDSAFLRYIKSRLGKLLMGKDESDQGIK